MDNSLIFCRVSKATTSPPPLRGATPPCRLEPPLPATRAVPGIPPIERCALSERTLCELVAPKAGTTSPKRLRRSAPPGRFAPVCRRSAVSGETVIKTKRARLRHGRRLRGSYDPRGTYRPSLKKCRLLRIGMRTSTAPAAARPESCGFSFSARLCRALAFGGVA